MPSKTSMVHFLSLTCICQNVPDSVKFLHLSFALMMLFGLSNKRILYICNYQTPCRINNSPSLDQLLKWFELNFMNMSYTYRSNRKTQQMFNLQLRHLKIIYFTNELYEIFDNYKRALL